MWCGDGVKAQATRETESSSLFSLPTYSRKNNLHSINVMIGINWHEQTKWPWETLEFLRVNVIALTSSDETLNSPHAATVEASASRKSCGHVWNRRGGRQVPSTTRSPRSLRNTRSGDRKTCHETRRGARKPETSEVTQLRKWKKRTIVTSHCHRVVSYGTAASKLLQFKRTWFKTPTWFLLSRQTVDHK